jgi:uncharacterized protein (DUF58 family)
VHLRRYARGWGLLAILLSAGAFILDDMAVLLAAGMLLSGLCGQYLIFDRGFRAMAGSVQVRRSLERSLVRRGTTIRVTATITVTVPPRVQAGITERIPTNVAVQDGVTSVTADSAASPQTIRLAYRITPLVHGEMNFSGLSLMGRSLLFEDRIELLAGQFSGPALFVQPTGMFEPSSRRTSTETREIEKMSVLSGLGIRALREYYAGDDLRRIDWKLSAKHDKLFVREYAGVMSLPPLIIVDLPWRGAPCPSKDFDRMVAMVAGMVEYCARTYQYVSVLVISGPNILHFMGDEKDLQRCMSVLREWMHPAERTVHFYRITDRTDLRNHIRSAGSAQDRTTDAATLRFLGTLQKYYLATLQNQRRYAFTGQIVRVLSSLTADEVFLFSLFNGDISHIREIVKQAKTAKLRVHIRMPETQEPGMRAVYQGQLGADSLEAFA